MTIIGESGQGKSTFLDLLVGLHKPNTGDILINGKKSIYDDLFNWRRQMGMLLKACFIDSSIAESLLSGSIIVKLILNQ